MPSWFKLVGGWIAAALVAVAFSWGAVSQVRNRVIQPTVEIPTTIAAPTNTTTTTAAPTTIIRVEPEVVDPTTVTVTPTSTPPGESETTTTSVTADTTQPPAATTTTAAPATTTTQPPATTTTTTTTEPTQTETSSYSLAGGTVTIRHMPGMVSFVSAIPQAGFSAEVREEGPDRVRVRFESETHTSDFRAEWESGELKITKNETGED